MGSIAIAGTIVADIIKMIDIYPEKGMLADITEVIRGIGGCASNTAVSLKKLDPAIDVRTIALVGDDENGRYLKEKLRGYGVDTSMICTTDQALTSFCDVMTVRATGERTFFLDRGCCRLFDETYLMREELAGTDLILLGYGGLLDAFNAPDAECGTRLARAMRDLKALGIRTAMDVASMHDAEEMRQVILPALPYVDYLIINEMEGGMLADIPPRDEFGKLLSERLRRICERLMAAGTQRCCVLHAPETGCAMTADGAYCEVPSLDLPKGYIAGAVGAGDAFCAGMLYSIHRGLPVAEALRVAAATAAANLSAADSVSGARGIEEVRRLYDMYHR
ncbi:MAG: carbohydrate kinase family protein [Clostridia bacterium]|nr:carbohydrate kinase family protein [Clostridia bacterium]